MLRIVPRAGLLALALSLIGSPVAMAAVPTAATGGVAPTVSSAPAHGKWMRGVTVSEYWAAPEAWFTGRAVSAPGLPGTYPIDWLFSATGVAMDGQGLTTGGRLIHLAATGRTGWVTARGIPTDPADGWAAGPPFWLAGGYWKTRSGAVTYPLAAGAWSNGTGTRYIAVRGVRFAAGAGAAVTPWQTIAVDPHVVALGSRVYIPAYASDGYGGWFLATDTGGGIVGRHLDVYRPPPATPTESGRHLAAQRVLVIPPHH